RLRSAKLDSLAEFAAGAGHELNNPLAVIVGRAQLLLARTSDPAAMRSLRAILSQAQRAHRILRDLIYVARPPAPRTRPCVPDEIWRASIRDSRPEAEERGILLAWDGPDQNRRVWMDPDGLRHLADTLIRNAIEATPRGGAVRVSTSGNAIALRWSVQDTGQGLSPADATHLFDLFYCGRQAGRGLGLGLPRVARFVELAGGEIHWQSSPGQGTTFVVKLPPSEVPQPPPPLSGPENQPIRRATA
ncbi:MAG: HAMP domain-containing sensor histidine kinase, partial [Isosphaeraceae bacterium]